MKNSNSNILFTELKKTFIKYETYKFALKC